MSQKPETKYIATIHRKLSEDIYWMKNNNDYTGGIPDVWYSGKKDLWVEYKFLPRIPVRAVVNPLDLLSALQADWLEGRYNEGRSVAVVIGCTEGGVILTDLAWERTMSADEFRQRLVPNLQISDWIVNKVQLD